MLSAWQPCLVNTDPLLPAPHLLSWFFLALHLPLPGFLFIFFYLLFLKFLYSSVHSPCCTPNPFLQCPRGLQACSKRPIKACFQTSTILSRSGILLPTSKITLFSSLVQAIKGNQALLKSSGSSPLELHPLALPSGELPCKLLQIKTQALHGPIPFHRPFPLPGITDLFSCQFPPHPSKHNSNIPSLRLLPNSLDQEGVRCFSLWVPSDMCCHLQNITSLPTVHHSDLFTPISPIQVGEPFMKEPGLSQSCISAYFAAGRLLPLWKYDLNGSINGQ